MRRALLALFNSGNPPSLAIVRVTPKEVVLALRVEGSQTYSVEASADLVTWVPLTNAATAGTNLLSVPSGSAQRFYRLMPASKTE